MTLFRITFVLGCAFAFMLTIVVLRAESAALNFEISKYDTLADVKVRELRERELELARLKNPARIRARVAELRLGETDAPARISGVKGGPKPSEKTRKP